MVSIYIVDYAIRKMNEQEKKFWPHVIIVVGIECYFLQLWFMLV